MKSRLLCFIVLLLLVALPAVAESNEKVVGIGVAIKVEGYSDKTPENEVRVSKDHPLRVIELTRNSPSIDAGLKVGDVITKVDGTSVEGLPLKDIVMRIRGKANTRVNISFKRADAAENQITIERKPLVYTKETGKGR